MKTFLVIFIIINLVVWIPWLWRYRIQPAYVRKNLRKKLTRHPKWNEIEPTLNLLLHLYKNSPAYRVSLNYRERLSIDNDDFVYGEIDYLSFFSLLEKINPQPTEIFYDLGSGAGKAVFAAALFFDLSKVCGIELVPGLYSIASKRIEKAKLMVKQYDKKHSKLYLQRISQIHFIKGDFLKTNFTEADIVYINATCMSVQTWEAIVEKLLQLKRGSRIIVNTKTIKNERFESLYQGNELMSWGFSVINIYKKI